MIGKTRFCKGCGLNGVLKGKTYHVSCRPFKPQVYFVCPVCKIGRMIYQRNDRGLPVKCKQCYLNAIGGENNPRWKGGITPLNKKFRASKEYANWRQAVFERDGYTCVLCGQIGGVLHAHHVKAFSKFPKLRLDVNNGRTLCFSCHTETDNYCGRMKL